jgi:hypothetical protein
VQRLAALAAIVRATGGLAVDRDQVGLGLTQALDPGREACLEQPGIERGDNLAQRVVARDAVPVRQEAAQEGQVLPAPEQRPTSVTSSAPARVAQSSRSRISGSG